MPELTRERRWVAPTLEIATSCGVAVAYFATCYLIKIKPTERMGQVAGLAALSYRFLLFATPLVVALIAIAKHRPACWDMAVRHTCAAFAGLASAIVAGGVLCMLRGTPYGLGGDSGDILVLSKWARELQRGGFSSGIYPPLQIHLLVWISDLRGVDPVYAAKTSQLLGILAVGPAAYASWRLVLRPMYALGIGVVAALPLIEAYRPYPLLVLAMFLPLAIKFLETLQRSPERSFRALAVRGTLFGLGFGLLFLLYSGWFQWSAPGFFITGLVVFPWRRAPRRAAALCAPALVAFVAITAFYLSRVLASPPLLDNFYYFDSTIEPTYVAMWRGDLPGLLQSQWPPVGELGGVGLFTVALCTGWAMSIALGARLVAVMATSWIMVGAWFLRLYHARRMWQTKLVQLYPRTTAELLYCLLILTGLAIHLYVERRRERASEISPLRSSWGVIGVLSGLALLFMSSGSAVTDRYMPRNIPNDYGHLAWLARVTPLQEANQAAKGSVEVSSAQHDGRLAAGHVVDEDPTTEYESALSATADHEEWVEVTLPLIRKFSRVILVPAGDGFPVDFTIDVWDGVGWLPRVTRQGYRPTPGPQTFTWEPPDSTSRVRLRVTKLGPLGNQFGLHLAELEVFQ